MSNIDRCRETRRMVQDGANLVDVRSPAEFASGALPNAINLPVQAVFHAEQVLAKDQPVVLYCATGRRSAQAKQILEQMGFPEVHDLGSHRNFSLCH